MEIGLKIATLKKGELQIKYAKDIVAKDKEIEMLKTKWDKLKKWANEPKVYICNYHILDKMNEIEQGSEKD